LLDAESAGGAAGTFSRVSTARLCALACVFTRHLAYLLARLYWFAFPGRSLRDHRLCSHAAADQPRQNTAEDSMMMERIVLKIRNGAAPRAASGARARWPHDAGSAFFSTRGKRLRIRMRRLRCSGFPGHLCIHHVDF